jgi:hypothetical protein
VKNSPWIYVTMITIARLRSQRKAGKPVFPPPAYCAKKTKALFYTQLRPKRNLPRPELIEAARVDFGCVPDRDGD